MKTVRVLELACGSKPFLHKTLKERFPDTLVVYHGVNNAFDSSFSLNGSRFNGGLNFHLHRIKLPFHNPRKLKKALEELFPGQKFDEIHFHMPNHGGNATINSRNLKVLAGLLSPGGRLYHIFQNKSALFDFEPAKADYPSKRKYEEANVIDEVKKAFAFNEKNFKKIATNAGLTLEKHGLQQSIRELGEFLWMTRRSQTPEKIMTRNNPFLELLHKYTRFPIHATHFVILRKPK